MFGPGGSGGWSILGMCFSIAFHPTAAGPRSDSRGYGQYPSNDELAIWTPTKPDASQEWPQNRTGQGCSRR